MYTSIAAGSLLAALTLAAPLSGQQVAADVVLRGGPIAGHVMIGDAYSTYRRPVVVYRRAPERVVVVERYAPRVVMVERVRGHGYGRHWRKQGYQPVTLYYLDGRFYDREVREWPPMREVTVYQRNGRFYSFCGHDDGWDDHGRNHERHERDWDD